MTTDQNPSETSITISGHVGPPPNTIPTYRDSEGMEISLHMQGTHEHAEAILLNSFTMALRERLAAVNKRIREARLAYTKINRSIEDFLRLYGPQHAAATEAASTYTTLATSISSFLGTSHEVRFSDCSVHNAGGASEALIYTVSIVKANNNVTLTKEIRIPVPEDLSTQLAERKSINRSIEDLTIESGRLEYAMSNREVLRDEAKARISEHIFSKSASGKALVDQLKAQVDVDSVVDSLIAM